MICPRCGYKMRDRALTVRQLQIEKMLVNGMSSKDIGNELGISYKSVNVHRQAIFRKRNVKNTVELTKQFFLREAPVNVDEFGAC